MRTRSLLPCVLILSLSAAGCGIPTEPRMKEKMNPEGPEARQWLRQNKNESALASNRFLETANAVRFVDQLYAAGAERVLVPEECITPEEPDGPYADALVVKLPADPAKRKKVFAMCAKEIKREGFDPDESTDGEWVFLWWD
jgi:hypothetical protein